MTKMSEEDYEAVKEMLREGALVPIETERLPRSGWVMTYCGDGDVTPHTIPEHSRLFSHANGTRVCAHQIHWDGGPAGISKNSPFHRLFLGEKAIVDGFDFICARIEGALKIKGERIKHWCGVPHCTCGMCRITGTNVWENFRLAIEGKDALRRAFNDGRLEHFKLFPCLEFTGYPEEVGTEGAFWNRLLRRETFESLYSRRTSQTH